MEAARSDQTALDDLFAAAQQHLAAAAYAAHALPMEVFLLAMLLEEHKEVLRLRGRDLTGNNLQIYLKSFAYEALFLGRKRHAIPRR